MYKIQNVEYVKVQHYKLEDILYQNNFLTPLGSSLMSFCGLGCIVLLDVPVFFTHMDEPPQH